MNEEKHVCMECGMTVSAYEIRCFDCRMEAMEDEEDQQWADEQYEREVAATLSESTGESQ